MTSHFGVTFLAHRVGGLDHFSEYGWCLRKWHKSHGTNVDVLCEAVRCIRFMSTVCMLFGIYVLLHVVMWLFLYALKIFLVHVRLRQKYYAPQVQPDWGSNQRPPIYGYHMSCS